MEESKNKSFEELRKYWESNRKFEIPNIKTDPHNDICILCGKETPYPIDFDVTLRHCYVEGKGQLCVDCCKKINN